MPRLNRGIQKPLKELDSPPYREMTHFLKQFVYKQTLFNEESLMEFMVLGLSSGNP